MEYTFRELEPHDLFAITTIIGEIGMDEFAGCFNHPSIANLVAGGNVSTTTIGYTVGFQIANIIFKNLSRCEDHIYKLLASVAGVKVDAIRHMGMVVAFVRKDEFMDFFKVASELFKTQK